ncbi:MAG: S-adenosylmethionine:tRNA ribosyltransferase-isomerase [Kofleriaceae bacterium]
MKVDQFDFDLPTDRIALRPARPRDAARMLVVEGALLSDGRVTDLANLLRPEDVLVFNDDTRVIPAQLEGIRGKSRIGVTLHKRAGLRSWWAFVRNAKRVRNNDVIDFGQGVSANAMERDESGAIRFDFAGDEPVEILLKRAGHMPLPPYIASKRPTDADDAIDYQTIFAREAGAVAAPTAALHFTDAMIAAVDARGIVRETLTLHVGAGPLSRSRWTTPPTTGCTQGRGQRTSKVQVRPLLQEKKV